MQKIDNAKCQCSFSFRGFWRWLSHSEESLSCAKCGRVLYSQDANVLTWLALGFYGLFAIWIGRLVGSEWFSGWGALAVSIAVSLGVGGIGIVALYVFMIAGSRTSSK